VGVISKKNPEGEFYPKEEDKLGRRGTSRFTLINHNLNQFNVVP